MARILGAKRLQQKLKALRLKSRKKNNGSVIVGYTAEYAVFVHENIEMKLKGKRREIWFTSKAGHKIRIEGKFGKGRYWDPQGRGQSKFLEQPFREKSKEIAKIAQKTAEKTGSIVDGLVIGGLFLQGESQKLVPVDTGNLKGSAFTRKE